MNHVLSDQEEVEKQVAPPAKERKRCVCIVVDEACLNGRCLNNLTPKSKLMPLGGEVVKKEIEEPRMSFGGKT